MLSDLFAVFLFLIALLLSVPMLVVIIECLSTFLQDKKGEEAMGLIERPRIGVLMPAHNESLVIADSILSVLSQLVEGDRLLVVADNCIDDTAKVALGCGADVIERFDSQLQGKGFALDAGVREFEKNPPEVLIVIDADCKAAEDAIAILAKKSIYFQRPMQATYLMQSGRNYPSRYEVFSQFAMIIKNWVRPLGLSKIGMPCMLTGSGMAFPWAIIRSAELACSHITEDLKLGLDMALEQHPAALCPEVLVTSLFPVGVVDQEHQRKRWEHGYLNIVFQYVPRLWFGAFKQRRLDLLAISFDLMVPPLALLCLLLLFGLSITMTGFLFDLRLPCFFLSGVSVVFFLTLILVRNQFAKEVISVIGLLQFPFYMFMKLPIYVGYVFNRETQWRETKRK